METTSRTLKQKAIEQMKEFLLIALYLFLVLGLLVVYKSMILAEHHIPVVYHGFALINALALGKVMLVAKDLHLGERFDDAPLIYPTLLKTALFTVVLACFKILEDAAVGLYHGKSFRGEHCRVGWGHLAGNPDSDAAPVRGAHSFRRIRRTEKSSWRREIETALLRPTLRSKPVNKRSGVVGEIKPFSFYAGQGVLCGPQGLCGLGRYLEPW